MPNVRKNIVTFADEFHALKSTIYAIIVEVRLRDIVRRKRSKVYGRLVMSREQLLELEDVKRSLLVQAYRMKQEHPHMSPVGIEMEMYSALMAEVKEITTRIQMSAEA
mgnify:FL=1